MTTHDVRFGGSGIPQTVLPPEPDDITSAIAEAIEADAADARLALADVAAKAPRTLTVWAELGDRAADRIEAYAYYRIGYHRGLDTLRQHGWRGSGFVRWEHPTNRGFLRCLDGLQRKAAEIDETDEADRCALFLRQLDPSWPPDAT